MSYEDPRITLLKNTIRDIPDFPKPGILFKDVTPMLAHAEAFRGTIELLAEQTNALRPEAIVGMESRGFIFGAPLAMKLGIPFIPARKPGKLPADKVKVTYALEYGTDSLEMHRDSLSAGQRTLIVDDLIATGGTARAAAELCREVGGQVVGYAFVIELSFLPGASSLAPLPVTSLIRVD